MMSVMDCEILTGCFSFVFILALTGAIFGQHLLLGPGLPRREKQRLAALDVLDALAVIGVVATGMRQRMMVGKASAFYSRHPVLPTALELFGLAGTIDSRSERRATSACCS
jgi:uncharacterized membrane protein